MDRVLLLLKSLTKEGFGVIIFDWFFHTLPNVLQNLPAVTDNTI